MTRLRMWENAMPLKISFTTLCCPDWTVPEIVSKAVKYGYDAVDFRCVTREMAIWNLPEFSTEARDTARRIYDAGLAVSGFSSSARMFAASADKRRDHIEEIKRYAELCDLFGVQYIRVFGGKLEGTPLEEAIDISLDTLARMSNAAGEARIAVETHDDWVNTDYLAKLFKKVSADNVFVLWDLHHPFRQAGEAPEHTCENIGSLTRYTHVKDSAPAADGGFVSKLPGQGGNVPLARMVDLLVAGGYDGYLTLEWEKMWHPEIADADVALPAYAPFLRSLAGRAS